MLSRGQVVDRIASSPTEVARICAAGTFCVRMLIPCIRCAEIRAVLSNDLRVIGTPDAWYALIRLADKTELV